MTATFGRLVVLGLVGLVAAWIVGLASMDTGPDWLGASALFACVVCSCVAATGIVGLVLVAVA